MNKDKAIELLKQANVLMEGHFLLTSGRHSGKYMQAARIFQNYKYAEELCADLAEQFRDCDIDIVVGPALGAVQMAYEMSRQLHCENFFTEREDGVMTLRRGFKIKPGQRVLIVEDVVTTGGSVKETIEVVKAAGGDIAGVGCIVDRSGGEVDFGVDFKAVLSLKVESYDAESCPLCSMKDALPLIKPGSRKITK